MTSLALQSSVCHPPSNSDPSSLRSANSPFSILNSQFLKAFTLIELLVVIAISCILLALLLPALRKAKEMANQVVCTNNLRQLHTAAMNYCNDNDGSLPVHYNGPAPYACRWPLMLVPYLGGPNADTITSTTPSTLGSLEIRRGHTYKTVQDTSTHSSNPFYCPSTRGTCWALAGPPWYDTASEVTGWVNAVADICCDYGINYRLAGVWNTTANSWTSGGCGPGNSAIRMFNVQPAARIPLFADSNSHNIVNTTAFDGPDCPRHLGKKNMIFVDGHANIDIVWTTVNPGAAQPYNLLFGGTATSPNLKYVTDPQ